MIREYDVQLRGTRVGKAQVSRQGLYYQVHVRCTLDGEIMHKLLVRCDGNEENLGILVPVDGQFGVDSRILVKKIGVGDLRFEVIPKHPDLQGLFVPLVPEEPFRYIARLKNSYLERRAGRVGIVIKDPGHG